jgi:GNAT superfamily N-acetyltransferase
MKEDMRIRPARPGESGLLTRMAHRSKSYWGYPAEWMAAWKEDLKVREDQIRRKPVRVCTLNGAPAGFYAIDGDAEVGEISHFWVIPEAMGRGLGRLMLEDALDLARQRGYRRLIVVSDPNAEGFYRKRGGVRVDTQTTHYADFERSMPVLSFDVCSAGGAFS